MILLDDVHAFPLDYDLVDFSERIAKATERQCGVGGTCREGAEFETIARGASNVARFCEPLRKFRLRPMTAQELVKLAASTGMVLVPKEARKYSRPGNITMRVWIGTMAVHFGQLPNPEKDALRAIKMLYIGGLAITGPRLQTVLRESFHRTADYAQTEKLLETLWREHFLLSRPSAETLGRSLDFGLLEQVVSYEEGREPNDERWAAFAKALENRETQSISELVVWQRFYGHRQQQKEADGCVDRMLLLEPVSAWECDHLLKFCKDRGEEKRALAPIAKWVEDHPAEWRKVGVSYLGLMETYADKDDLANAIQKTKSCLAEHLDDSYLRVGYLGVVERNAPALVGRAPKLQEETIADTEAWLRKAWLRDYNGAKDVCVALMSWLSRIGRGIHACDLASIAISHHPDDENVHFWYVCTLQNTADEKTVRDAYEKLTAKYPKNTNFQLGWANWLSNRESSDDHKKAQQCYQELKRLHPSWWKPLYRYGMLLLLKMDAFDDAADQFKTILKRNFGSQEAHNGLAQVRWRKQDYVLAEIGFNTAIDCAERHKEPTARFFTDLGRFYNDRKCWTNALKAFESASSEDPDFFGNYRGKGKALIGLKRYVEAEQALRTALEKQPNLQPHASEQILELLRQCTALTQGAESVEETEIASDNGAGEAPVGSVQTGRVFGKNQYSVVLEVAFVRGWCQISEWSNEFIESLEHEAAIGDDFQVKVIGHTSKGLLLSRIAAVEGETTQSVAVQPAIDSVHPGRVIRADPNFVYLNVAGLRGRCHISEWSTEFVDCLEDEAAIGDEFQVKVIGHAPKGLLLSRIAVTERGAEAADKPEITSESPAVQTDSGTVLMGRVTGVAMFGVFVKFARDVDGLCHISEWTTKLIDPVDLRNEVKTGDKISVMVIGKNEKGLLLSRKAVIERGENGGAKMGPL